VLLPSGPAPLHRALLEHGRHRSSWYAGLVGALMLPVVVVPHVLRRTPGSAELAVIGAAGRLSGAVAALDGAGFRVRQVEAPVAKRGQDPVPGLRELLATELPAVDVYAEIPLTWGVTEALDVLAEARRDGRRVAAKFRTGGLAAELYPTPAELAGVIIASRDRGVPFKLTAGLHRAVRRGDPDTGFVHHGFLNILAACLAAANGAPAAAVTERLALTDAVPLIEASRAQRADHRPLWTSFGSCDLSEPVADLKAFGLV
jgi:hypothetical protein